MIVEGGFFEGRRRFPVFPVQISEIRLPLPRRASWAVGHA